MSIVEILDIKLHRQSKHVLRGFGLDGPIVGSRYRAEGVAFRGWVIGGESAVLAIEFVAGGGLLWRADTGYWREDIARDFVAVAGAERSGFSVLLDLTRLPPVVELAIHAILANGQRLLLGHIRGRRTVQRPGVLEPDPAPLEAGSSQPVTPAPSTTDGDDAADPRVGVVIPVHNQSALTLGCLEALFGSGGATIPFEVIVVDDGSVDATPEMVAGFEDRVRVVRLDPNAGFAAACNAGAAVATAEYIVFLNNDTIPQPGWLDALVAHADAHPKAAIVGAKLLYPDGTVQHAGVSFIPAGYPHHLYAGFPADHPAVNRTRRFQAVTAACCLVRAGVFRALGGFDRAFVNGWEDVDFCLRAGAAGHHIHYCPTSVVLHLESASRDGASFREIENRRRWAQRWLGRVRGDCFDFWVADSLLAVDVLGPRYPVRLRLAPELGVRGLNPLFTADAGTGRIDGGDRVHPARTAFRMLRPNPGAKRSARRAAIRPRLAG